MDRYIYMYVGMTPSESLEEFSIKTLRQMSTVVLLVTPRSPKGTRHFGWIAYRPLLLFLTSFIIRPWRRRWHLPSKRRAVSKLCDVTIQKNLGLLYIVTALRTSNPKVCYSKPNFVAQLHTLTLRKNKCVVIAMKLGLNLFRLNCKLINSVEQNISLR
jgi:hypothetical protein